MGVRHGRTAAPTQIPKYLYEACSRGEITRREIEDRTGKVLGFGVLLIGLWEHHLPLPRMPVDLNSRGVQLIRRLVERARRVYPADPPAVRRPRRVRPTTE
jgi:hypothetical protein